MKRLRIIEDDVAIRTELTTLLLTNGYPCRGLMKESTLVVRFYLWEPSCF